MPEGDALELTAELGFEVGEPDCPTALMGETAEADVDQLLVELQELEDLVDAAESEAEQEPIKAAVALVVSSIQQRQQQ